MHVDLIESVETIIQRFIVEPVLNQDVHCFSQFVLSLCSRHATVIDVVVCCVVVLYPAGRPLGSGVSAEARARPERSLTVKQAVLLYCGQRCAVVAAKGLVREVVVLGRGRA